MRFKLLLVIPMFGLFGSCSENEGENLHKEELVHVETKPVTRDELEIIMIPTPVQVPTVLSLANCQYNAEYIEKNYFKDHPTTSHQKAINLGISIVDFSYSAVNKDHLLSNKKLALCLELMNDLGIDIPKDKEFLERVEKNKNNIDSLSYLILTAFDRSTQYFKDTDKEQLGISILTGTALESSLLLVQNLEPDRNQAYFTYFNQQKDYAMGLQLIIARYKDEASMQNNLKIAKNLEKAFHNFELWAASGDTLTRFDTNKANLLSDIFLIKENSLH